MIYVFGIVAFLCLVLAVVVFMVWRAFLEIQPASGSAREWPFKNACEDLVMGGRDGRLFRAEKPTGVVCILHNWGASKNRYYAIADDLASHGLHAFVFDLPGHGERRTRHPFWVFALMPRMVRETRCIVQALRSYNLPVYLMGYSMGAGIALEVFKQERDVPVVVCDSGPFSLTLDVIGMLVARQMPERSRAFRAFTQVWFWIAVNLTRRHRVLENLHACRERRALLVENGRESFVTVDEVRALSQGWPGPVKHWKVERAQHLMAYSVDRHAYVREVVGFLKAT